MTPLIPQPSTSSAPTLQNHLATSASSTCLPFQYSRCKETKDSTTVNLDFIISPVLRVRRADERVDAHPDDVVTLSRLPLCLDE
ncbi:hypothetical protein P7K49_007313 [Saguinus oedipus]|uniref:Uncharacterized protein n=1 Tax=Saguinus oedipus TaxID=9490 RepID=A0ABQ9VY25_SAGOE|nr:hypothetical protein P7K49_007313 [Saguinus oedipus]